MACYGIDGARMNVRVTPNAKKARVEKMPDGSFKAWVDAPAVGGKANRRLLKVLSLYLGMPASRLSIKSGLTGRNKTIQIKGQHEERR